MNEILRSIYYDPHNKASFSSTQKLYAEAKKRDPSITLQAVKEWLQSQLNYTLHKPVRRTWKRNRVIVHGINEEFQADLVDMQKYSRQNKGYRWILTVIDVLSKFAWVIKLKSKQAKDVVPAFRDFFEKLRLIDRVPEKLRTDRGSEFTNNHVRKIYEKYNVYHSTTNNPQMKCSVIERFNRTLKGRMWKWFTYTKSNKYFDVLDDMVDAYNASQHRSIGMAPKDVTIANQDVALRNLYDGKSIRSLLKAASDTKQDLRVGDKVRIHHKVKTFDKGYWPNWTDHIYSVKQIIKAVPRPIYVLQDYNRKERRFYREELQKVKASDYRIEKIIKGRTKNGVDEVYVKWVGYPQSANSWIPKANLVKNG
jgi:Integrase core domain/Chromo (CHRromatin Organisation MOdifier) domain